jgi:hypothetical protein
VECALERRIAAAQHGEVRAAVQDLRYAVEDEVHTLLPGEPAHDAEQGAGRRDAEMGAQLVAARAARHAMPGVERRGQVRVVGRIPCVVVDAVADATQRVCPVAQQSVEAHPARGRLDLLGVRGRHRGDAVGEL